MRAGCQKTKSGVVFLTSEPFVLHDLLNAVLAQPADREQPQQTVSPTPARPTTTAEVPHSPLMRVRKQRQHEIQALRGESGRHLFGNIQELLPAQDLLAGDDRLL